jgi:epsin
VRRRPQNDDDDLEYKLALEASKNEAEQEAARRAKARGADTDDDLAKAIKLSKEEEELRRRQLEDQQQENLLFDDTPDQAPQPTGFNQGYQQQVAVDWFGNPLQQQQPQQTGFLNNAYSQSTGIQPQQTAFQNGYGYQQPQPTGWEQMQVPQHQFIQPQNTYNPWANQMNAFGQPQQPIQEQPTAQPGSNNPWASNTTQTSIAAQPTGSNNPFAAQTQQRQTSSSYRQPTLDTLREQQTSQQFQTRPNPIQNFQPSPSTSSPVQPQQRLPPPQDPYQAKLSALLASGEGQDTFGNTGDLRIPAQHTAPGTFVNSAGAGSMGRLEASKTGTNPFFSQPQQQYPAQTGPATGFGGQNNPFGSRPPQQQQQQQGGSLIDL